MSFINSNNILVFPSTRRGQQQLSSRYQQESTFTETVYNICRDNEGSFIITHPVDTTISGQQLLWYYEDQPFEFSIKGYRFIIKKLRNLIDLFPSSKKIYAYIDLDVIEIDEITEETRTELKGRDAQQLTEGEYIPQYTGVKFVDTFTPAENRYGLLLFDRGDSTSTNWYQSVYVNSLARFSSTECDFKIDGGIII